MLASLVLLEADAGSPRGPPTPGLTHPGPTARIGWRTELTKGGSQATVLAPPGSRGLRPPLPLSDVHWKMRGMLVVRQLWAQVKGSNTF